MKKLLLLFVLMASAFAVAQAPPQPVSGPFTQAGPTRCARYLTPDGQNYSWTCTLQPVTFSDGSKQYTSFVVKLAQDGTFTGTFYPVSSWLDASCVFTGTYAGPETAPTSLTGTFSGSGNGFFNPDGSPRTVTGSVTENFGLITVAGYKGTRRTEWGFVGGAGNID